MFYTVNPTLFTTFIKTGTKTAPRDVQRLLVPENRGAADRIALQRRLRFSVELEASGLFGDGTFTTVISSLAAGVRGLGHGSSSMLFVIVYDCGYEVVGGVVESVAKGLVVFFNAVVKPGHPFSRHADQSLSE